LILLVFLAAFLLALSGFLFDSYWVKVISVPYPVIFILLGVVIAVMLIVVMRQPKQPKQQEEPVIFVFIMFLIFMIISTGSSIFGGAGNIVFLLWLSNCK
jgi:cytochrome bd-type quinol oxidase subunit 2